MLLLLATYAAIFILYLVVPGRWVKGYVRDRYHLNGLFVFVLSIALWALLGWRGLIRWDAFFTARWDMLATACVVGLVFTVAIVFGAAPTGRGLLADLYLGRRENPQWGRVDAKMFLYLIGAAMLALNILSCLAHHLLLFPDDPSPGLVLYSALFLFFLVEYLCFERVHLYTYDFVAERVGFKLGWGCLVFYPFFYCVGAWFAADQPNPHAPVPLLVLAALVFFSGWILARGANLQKFTFKISPERTRFGPFEQRALANGDKRVLISGFWGVSRHVNYLGEILMASGLAIAVGHPAGWLYPLYYVLLLVPRQIDDDKRCAEKYGPMWAEYKRAVPYRIVPWIY